MTDPNWNLLPSPADVGAGVTASFREGMAIGAQLGEAQNRRDVRSALSALRTDPSNPESMGVLFEHAPDLAAKMEARADDFAFRDAARDYLAPPSGGQASPIGAAPASPNALMAPGGGMPPQPGQNALLGLTGPTSSPAAQIGFSSPSAAPVAAGETPPASQSAIEQPAQGEGGQRVQAVVQQFGRPQDERDKAFLRMLARDPMEALKLQGQMRDNLVGRMESELTFYNVGLDLMSRANDEQSWQGMLARVVPMAAEMGVDVGAILPAQYPGEEAVADLMERALPVKERLAHLLNESNVEADNERADINTDSLVETREERLAEYRRHNRANEGNTRRGQDVRSETSRRGQDVRDETTRRGQDVRQSGKPPKRERIAKVTTVEEARALKPGTRFQTPDGRVMVR